MGTNIDAPPPKNYTSVRSVVSYKTIILFFIRLAVPVILKGDAYTIRLGRSQLLNIFFGTRAPRTPSGSTLLTTSQIPAKMDLNPDSNPSPCSSTTSLRKSQCLMR